MLPEEGLTPEDYGADAPTHEGKLALGQMARLAPLLADAHGEVCLSVAGRLDEKGRRVIEGTVSAELRLTCQRCLGVCSHQVEELFRLTLVGSEAEGEELPDELEPYVSLNGEVRLIDLVEEQLLLAMPIVARHQEGECAPPPNPAGALREDLSPFAQLRGLFDDNNGKQS